MRLGPFFIVAWGIVACIGGAWAALGEANQFINGDGAPLPLLVEGTLTPGLSSPSMQSFAETCVTVAPRLETRFLPAQDRERFNSACKEQVQALAQRNPLNSSLWLAQAQLAWIDGDAAALNEGIVNSQASGPNEYWLASRRMLLSERALALLEDDARQSHDADIRILAGVTRGSRLLAAQYVLSPEFRPRATAIIESLPNQTQHLFLAHIRSMTASGGPQ